RLTPARHFRIYTNKWYLCTFQNVERDPRCDYVGLAQGEYVELLPGKLARQARDASLNHLNSILLWRGEVWAVIDTQCGGTTYYPAQEMAETKVAAINAKNDKDWQECQESVDKQLERTDADIEAVYGKCSDWGGVADWRESLETNLDRSSDYFSELPTTERIR
ncbi:unnamed protein product, partial [marine sediment metagenome]